MIPINSHKIIGAAVYDTMLDLSKDDKYIDSLLAYEYELGLHSFDGQVPFIFVFPIIHCGRSQ